MDPNQCLKELMELTEKLRASVDSYGSWVELAEKVQPEEVDEFIADVDDAVNHIDALNGWLKKGGFLPQEWQQKPGEPNKMPATTIENLDAAPYYTVIKSDCVATKKLHDDQWTAAGTFSSCATVGVIQEAAKRSIAVAHSINGVPFGPCVVDENVENEMQDYHACLEYLARGGMLVKLPDAPGRIDASRFYCVVDYNRLQDKQARDTLPGC